MKRAYAYSLVEILVCLPILGTASTLGFMLVAQGLKMDGQEKRDLVAQAAFQDVVRRFQMDVRNADQVTPSEPAGERTSAIMLTRGSRRVSYKYENRRMIRTEFTGDRKENIYQWVMDKSEPAFRVEKIGSTPRLVWMTAMMTVPTDHGPDVSRSFAVAAILGQGGLP